MRLWHQALIPVLDGPRLLDTHMSCCNLRGLGWGRKNSAVNYVFSDPNGEDALAVYHVSLLREMIRRGYNFDYQWLQEDYCGKRRPIRNADESILRQLMKKQTALEGHTEELFLNDVYTLQERGVPLTLSTVISVGGDLIYQVEDAERNVHIKYKV